METFFSSLGLATLSAISFLAYRHPAAYRKIYPALGVILLVTVTAAGAWNMAVSNCLEVLWTYIAPGKAAEALDLASTIKVPLWMWLAAASLGAYFAFLTQLYKLLDTKLNEPRHKD
jgi:hypothetical protein